MESLPQSEIEANPLFQPLVSQLSALTRSIAGPDATFEQQEAAMLQVSNLAGRQVLERQLQSRSDALGEEVLVNGVLHRRHEEGEVRYHSLAGPLSVRRSTYRKVGERNGPTLVPLELMAGLVEGATPALGYSVTLGYAQAELRSYLESMTAAHRDLPSRSTVERLAKAIGRAAKANAPHIEPQLRQAERLPEGAHGISMGLDRTSVPMEEDRPADAPPKTRRKERTEPYQRAKPEPVDVNYRMAYVGTFSVVNAQGEELVTRRYTALPEQEPDEIVQRLMADLRQARRQDSELEVGVMQDGAPELWNATDRGLAATGVTHWHEGIDRWHLAERLGEALLLVESSAAARTSRLSAWNDDLDRSDQAIDRIQQWLGEQLDNLKDADEVEKYLDHLIYIENNKERMRYRRLKKAGLPVGSGLTEGACKSVIGQRTCGSGQRWRPRGIEAVLTLRATHRSERLPGFWRHLSKRYTAEIKRAA